jgi:hypothetical protein
MRMNVGPLMGLAVAVGAGDGLGTDEADRTGPDVAIAALAVCGGAVPAVAPQAVAASAIRAASPSKTSALRRSMLCYWTDSTQPLACVCTT